MYMKSFDEVFEDKTKYGTKIKTDEYQEKGSHLIIDQGQEQIAGYTNLEEGIFNDVPAIVFGDHTRVIKYVEEPFFLGADGVKVLKCRFPNANYKYLFYALRHAKIPDTGYNRHFKWLKEVRIAYPDPERQSEIVEILDKVSTIIMTRKQQLQKLDELVKSQFIEMFGNVFTEETPWEKVPFDKAVSDDTKRGTKIQKEEYLPAGTFPIYDQGQEYIAGYWNNPEGLYKNVPAIIFGDHTRILKYAGQPFFLGADGVKLLKTKREDLNYLFLLYELRAANIPNTGYNRHFKLLKELSLSIPPVELQEQFAAFVRQSDKSKFIIQQALDKTQLLFDSLMQSYFG